MAQVKSKEIGTIGEKIAENYLKKKGYKILEKNYRLKFSNGPLFGEIDIIAKEKDVIHFVEVKTLTESLSQLKKMPAPEEKVNYFKKKKIIKTAENWLTTRKIPLNSKWQIDVISIRINWQNKKAEIRHFPNVNF